MLPPTWGSHWLLMVFILCVPTCRIGSLARCPVPVSFPPTPQDVRVGVGPTSQEGGAAEPWVTQCPGHTTAACLPVAETLLCAMEATVRSCWTRPACHVTEVASCV